LSWKIRFQNAAGVLENFVYVDYQTICTNDFWKVTFQKFILQTAFGKVGGLARRA
jgi:hypothetical protein